MLILPEILVAGAALLVLLLEILPAAGGTRRLQAGSALAGILAALAAVFMLNSLALAWYGTRPATDTSRGLLGDTATEVTVPAAPAPVAPSVPTGIPATAPATAPAAPAAPSP